MPGDAVPLPKTRLSIVIPAFNEAQNVTQVVEETSAALAAKHIDDYELILVDDGSQDGTWDVMCRLQAGKARVKAVRHPANRGFGAALRTGYERSTGQFVTLLTSDGEFDPQEVLSLVDLAGDVDLVLSRRIRAQEVATPKRTVLSAGFGALTRWLLGFDPAGVLGVYVIRGSVLRGLDLRSDTGVLNIELPMRCFACNCHVKYGEIRVRPRLSGESKVTNIRTVVRTFIEILKLRASSIVTTRA